MAISDVFSSIAQVIGKSAPLLATALGSPLSGIAISIIAQSLGLNPTHPEDILAHLQTNPDSLVKMKELELSHEQELTRIAMETYQSQLSDVQNARATKTASEQFTGKKDWLITFLVISAVFLFGFCLVSAYFSSGATNQLLLFLIGQQSGVYLSVYAFYFSGIDPKKMFDNVVKEQKDKL
jgi:hypothetical protein